MRCQRFLTSRLLIVWGPLHAVGGSWYPNTQRESYPYQHPPSLVAAAVAVLAPLSLLLMTLHWFLTTLLLLLLPFLILAWAGSWSPLRWTLLCCHPWKPLWSILGLRDLQCRLLCPACCLLHCFHGVYWANWIPQYQNQKMLSSINRLRQLIARDMAKQSQLKNQLTKSHESSLPTIGRDMVYTLCMIIIGGEHWKCCKTPKNEECRASTVKVFG